jgi:hypothetical protein
MKKPVYPENLMYPPSGIPARSTRGIARDFRKTCGVCGSLLSTASIRPQSPGGLPVVDEAYSTMVVEVERGDEVYSTLK